MTAPDEPSPAVVLDGLFAYLRTAALAAGIRLDVFTAIGEGAATPATLAARTGAAERGLRALCDTLVVHGLLLKRPDGTYALTPSAATFLDRRSPACMGSTVGFLASPELLEMVLRDPAAYVRNGGAPGLAAIAPEHPMWVKFARAMAPFAAPLASGVADWAVAQGVAPRRVLDVSASHGLFGLAFARRFPDCTVSALDWAPVLEVAKENVAAAGLSERFRWIAGSAFEVPLEGPYDVILLPNFLHHFDMAGCVTLLRRMRGALSPGGLVLAPEFVPEEDRVSPPMPATFAFVMLATTPAGNAYTRAEFAEMLRQAGFGGADFAPLAPAPQTLMIGRA
ncbi:MAG: methyltransferase [Acetobacteraceae bacterium]|nr:methyltransferase [Acetobacteraceae bacterium]